MASPSGSATQNNTNPSNRSPDAGKTRYYDFTVSYAKIAPDGVEVEWVVINGTFPVRTIPAKWGDWIEVKVTNALPTKGLQFTGTVCSKRVHRGYEVY